MINVALFREIKMTNIWTFKKEILGCGTVLAAAGLLITGSLSKSRFPEETDYSVHYSFDVQPYRCDIPEEWIPMAQDKSGNRYVLFRGFEKGPNRYHAYMRILSEDGKLFLHDANYPLDNTTTDTVPAVATRNDRTLMDRYKGCFKKVAEP